MTREVLEGVRRRDPAALGRFYELTFDPIYALAFRLLGERSAAEDLTQEVYLRVYRAAERLDPGRDPLPWLRTIAANLARDRWRSFAGKVASRSVSIDDRPGVGATLANGRATPEARTLAEERDRLVQEALGRLPPELREVVVLRDYEGLGHAEIARIVGATHAAVRKRYSRALAQLGELLKDTW
jgi:RNA polymerase sigma-70 factor (ECF subfamily)